MKKLIIVLALTLSAFALHAQVGGVTYTPYTPPPRTSSSSSGLGGFSFPRIPSTPPSTSSSSSQGQSVTAYYVSSTGDVYRQQIRVAVENAPGNYGSIASYQTSYMYVDAVYSRTTGRWEKMSTKPRVSKCSAYTNDYMEANFMYRAMIGATYFYFDL